MIGIFLKIPPLLALTGILCLPFAASAASDIPLLLSGGVYRIPVRINDVMTLNAVLDTGAGDVQIPMDVVLTLIRSGTIQQSDLLPGASYTLADGSTKKSERLLLRELRIGEHRMENVTASIGEVEGEILLGQSFLSRFPAWSIDNRRQLLVINDEAIPQPSAPAAEATPPAATTSAVPPMPAPRTSKTSALWVAQWPQDVLAIASLDDCHIDAFKNAGLPYLFMEAIPLKRLANAEDSWFTHEERAVTVVGCWVPRKGNRMDARMIRRKDSKIWNWSGNLRDGHWHKVR